jgi:CRP-like cAMP-binding protein
MAPKVNFREIIFKLDPSVEICKVQDSKKISYFVMRNQSYNFLKLGPKEKLIVDNLIEGSSVEDISYEFFMEYSQLADTYIEHFINVLYKNNFLTKPYVNLFDHIRVSLRKRKKVSGPTSAMIFLKRKLLKNMIYIKSLHQYVENFYKKGASHLCSSKMTLLFNFSILLSIFIFYYFISFKNIDIFRVNGSLTLGMVVLFCIKAIHTSLHELGHALAVVHFKRKVIKGGLISFFGIPSFFVDTNDIWMRPKNERIMVSFAGPYVNLILNSFAIFLVYFTSNPLLEGFLLRFVAIGTLSVFINFNPLLAFDGYFMLIDYIGYPMLRDRALSFIKNFFSKKGQENLKRRPIKEILILSVYGISSIIWLVFFLGFVLNVMGLRTKEVLNELINSQSLLIKGFSFILISFFFLPIILSISALIFFTIRDFLKKLKIKYWDPYFDNKVFGFALLNSSFLFGLFFATDKKAITLSAISLISSFFIFKKKFLKENCSFFMIQFLLSSIIFLLSLSLDKVISFKTIFGFFTVSLIISILIQFKRPISFSTFFMLFFGLEFYLIFSRSINFLYFIGPLLFSITSYFYLSSNFLRVIDFKNKSIENAGLNTSDTEKIKTVFENHLNIFFKLMCHYFGHRYAKRFIKDLNKKSPDIFFDIDPLKIQYNSKIKDIHNLASTLKKTFLNFKTLLKFYFGNFYSKKLFLKILDGEAWVFREVFEEYVLSEGKKDIFDFSSLVENHLHFLSKLNLFSNFNESELQLILTNLKSYNFKENEILTKEGEGGDQMFILLEGNVNVFKFNESKEKNENVAILGPGDVFGERTLLLGEPRSATIMTKGEGSILIMAQAEFEKLLTQSQSFKKKIKKMVDENFKFYGLLKSVPLFKEIPDEKLKLLAPKIKYKIFEEGDYIFKQGDYGDSFYILKEGKVEILTESQNGQTKNILATLGAGEFFGEIALFKDITRTASVKSIKKTVALSIEKGDFSNVFSEKRTLERVSSRRLKEMSYSITKKES